MSEYEPIIGLEIHVELKTNSKMFCGCAADYFGKDPNTQTCPVCLGLPGALPVPNKKAVEWTAMLGLALGCEINEESKFDRKNYFYPDLPKGYQISQYDQPIARNGELRIKNHELGDEQEKVVRIRRVHLEEDTGKLVHGEINGEKVTLIDFNRSGVPLVEIVTEPDIRSSDEAKEFLKKLHRIIRYLGISDADMEKGSMRIEPNISLRKLTTNNSQLTTEELPKYKVEVKNINSFNFAKRAIDYEIKRQGELLNRGETPKQETRGWSETRGATVSQRSKEEAHDYRYFPEPDIPPMRFAQSQISNLKSQIPELPDARAKRFVEQYTVTEQDADTLCEMKELADYFERTVKATDNSQPTTYNKEFKNPNPKSIANWIINKKVDMNTVTPEELLRTITDGAKMSEIPNEQLEQVVRRVIEANSKAVADYRRGKTAVIGFLIGAVLKEAGASLDRNLVREKLEKALAQ